MSQAELAEAMVERGIPWKRATVVNLEKRGAGSRGATAGRYSITVQELLALALVLDVPPIMLLADPRHTDRVPVAQDMDVSTWDALLWLSGSGTIDRSDLGNFTKAAWLIQTGWGIAENLVELRKRERVLDSDDPASVARAQQRDDARHRTALQKIANCMIRLDAAGAPLPPILRLDDLVPRARELDVHLPGMDD